MPGLDRTRALAPLLLAKARTDLAAARIALGRGEDMEPWLAVFHAQQAGEKALKSLLIAEGIDPPHTHDLADLRRRLPDKSQAGVSEQEIDTLNKFSGVVRYVMRFQETPDPTWAEAEAAVAVAIRIVDAATAQIRGE
jgi:HEPN domain-containing protein